MGHLGDYIEERKERDSKFAEDFDSGYKEFLERNLLEGYCTEKCPMRLVVPYKKTEERQIKYWVTCVCDGMRVYDNVCRYPEIKKTKMENK